MTIELDKIYNADCLQILRTLPDECIDCVVTSPPYYGLRDYGCEGQIGLEDTPEEYVARLVDVFHEVKRCLKPAGTMWLNLGDSYNGNKKGNTETNKNKKVVSDSFEKKLWRGAKPKDLIGIPWMVAFALRADGWYLRQDIIFAKPNPMPESVKDRCTKSHEYIFLMTKSPKYYFDYEAIQEPAVMQDLKSAPKFGGNKYGDNEDRHFATYNGNEYHPKHKNLAVKGQQPNTIHLRRAEGFTEEQFTVRNKRDVWMITPKPSKEEHYAMYPEELVKYCVLAGCPVNGVVCDPFMGSGTTAAVARKFDRHYVGMELNPKFHKIAMRRVSGILSFAD